MTANVSFEGRHIEVLDISNIILCDKKWQNIKNKEKGCVFEKQLIYLKQTQQLL